MPILTPAGKWLVGLLLALCLSGLIYGLWARSEVSRLSAYTQALENRVAGLLASQSALEASLDTALKQRQAAEQRARKAQKELNDALKDHPDWAGTPVPDGVCRALGACPTP